MDNGYVVETAICEDGLISQDTIYVANGIREQIMQQVINTKDAQIRQALIDLGWTPPDEPLPPGTVIPTPAEMHELVRPNAEVGRLPPTEGNEE